MKNADQIVESLIIEKFQSGAINAKFKNKVYAVGGYVRDQVSGKDPDDLDIVLAGDGKAFGLAEEFAQELSKVFPENAGAPFRKNDGYPIWVVPFHGDYEGQSVDGAKIDVADSMKEFFPDENSRQREVQPATLEEDTKRRDFSMNMMLKNLSDSSIVDPAGGKKDMDNGVLAGHPDVSADEMFSADPIRILRMVRFAARSGHDIDPQLLAAAKRQVGRLSIISGERIRDELEKISKSGAMAKALEIMQDVGITDHALPGLSGLLQDNDLLAKVSTLLKSAPKNLDSVLYLLASRLHAGDFRDIASPAYVLLEGVAKKLRLTNESVRKIKLMMKAHHLGDFHGEEGVRKALRILGEHVGDFLFANRREEDIHIAREVANGHRSIQDIITGEDFKGTYDKAALGKALDLAKIEMDKEYSQIPGDLRAVDPKLIYDLKEKVMRRVHDKMEKISQSISKSASMYMGLSHLNS